MTHPDHETSTDIASSLASTYQRLYSTIYPSPKPTSFCTRITMTCWNGFKRFIHSIQTNYRMKGKA